MKASSLLAPFIVIAIAIAIVACDAGPEAPATGAGPTSNMPAKTSPAKPPAPPSALVTHMHRHAEQFEELNDALAAGDLDAVYTPAWWLSRHEQSGELVPDWQAHLAAMREAASDAEAAPDLATARAAVESIAEACNGCHSDADVEKVVYAVDPR